MVMRSPSTAPPAIGAMGGWLSRSWHMRALSVVHRLARSEHAKAGSRMRRMPGSLVVQKYGGSSVAGADRIKRVARRIARERAAGHDLVVVVSAMGDTTDELLGLAAAITDEPDPRELDVLLATGEHQSR